MNKINNSGKTDIIIFMGQSNMQGETEALIDSKPVEGAVEYKYLTDSLEALRNPAGEDIGHNMTQGYCFDKGVNQSEWLKDNVLGGACYHNSTLIPSFAKSYVEKTGRNVAAVPAARGSAAMFYWLPGTEGYNAVVAKAKAALKKLNGNYEHVYAVWLQGESDAIWGVSYEEYKKGLLAMKNELKKDIGIDKLGIIRVGLFASIVSWAPEGKASALDKDHAIQNAQEDLCREDEDFVMLTRIADKLLLGDSKYVNPNVGGHFSAYGLHVLGHYAGTNLGAFVDGSEYLPDEI